MSTYKYNRKYYVNSSIMEYVNQSTLKLINQRDIAHMGNDSMDYDQDIQIPFSLLWKSYINYIVINELIIYSI